MTHPNTSPSEDIFTFQLTPSTIEHEPAGTTLPWVEISGEDFERLSELLRQIELTEDASGSELEEKLGAKLAEAFSDADLGNFRARVNHSRLVENGWDMGMYSGLCVHVHTEEGFVYTPTDDGRYARLDVQIAH